LSVFLRELGRKIFHLLTLVYLGVYLWLPRPALLLGCWFIVVAIFEVCRLYLPAWNRFLIRPFRSIMREQELEGFSGIFYTSLGAWLTTRLFGERRLVVVRALLCLAFADAAAALAGRLRGRHTFRVAGRSKSLEGSVACFVVAFVCLRALGLPPLAAAVAASVCTALEAAPIPFDDNVLLPVGTALTLYLLGV